jgi:hypothetical protein
VIFCVAAYGAPVFLLTTQTFRSGLYHTASTALRGLHEYNLRRFSLCDELSKNHFGYYAIHICD